MTDKTRDSFIFYRSFFESTIPLNKEEKAELFDAICRYALDADQINLQGFPQAMFSLIKPQLDANRKKWINGCKEKTKSKDEPIQNQGISKTEAKDKQIESKTEGNVNVNGNVECKSELKIIGSGTGGKSTFKETQKKPKGFTPPTLEEVKNYCIERNNNVNPQKFFDYYNAGSWKDAKGKPVKNWKQKLINWEDGESKPKTQDPTAEINKILNCNLIVKIETSGSTAKLYFNNQADFEKMRLHPKKEEAKTLISKTLSTNKFEFNY